MCNYFDFDTEECLLSPEFYNCCHNPQNYINCQIYKNRKVQK